MVDHSMDTSCTNDGKPSTASGKIPTERVSPVSLLSNPLYGDMNLPVLAAHCVRELNAYRSGEPCTETYGIELLRRATVQGDQEAWAWVQRCFGGVVLNWLRGHPQRAHACRLESEENYVAQAFERFWQATASYQWVDFNTLTAALQYLRASLNSAILDTLQAYSRSKEIPLSQPSEPGEPLMTNHDEGREVWENIRSLLPNEREQQLAYLLFHCGLGPREIVRLRPQEWSDVCEIYRLRRNIFEQLLSNYETPLPTQPQQNPTTWFRHIDRSA